MYKKKKKRLFKGRKQATASKHGFLTLLVCFDPKDMALRVDVRDGPTLCVCRLAGGWGSV